MTDDILGGGPPPPESERGTGSDVRGPEASRAQDGFSAPADDGSTPVLAGRIAPS